MSFLIAEAATYVFHFLTAQTTLYDLRSNYANFKMKQLCTFSLLNNIIELQYNYYSIQMFLLSLMNVKDEIYLR